MAWKLNVFTGRLDYHKVGTYQAFTDANVTTWLVTHGFMEAAPYVAPGDAGGQVLQDDDGQVFQDDDGQVMQDG